MIRSLLSSLFTLCLSAAILSNCQAASTPDLEQSGGTKSLKRIALTYDDAPRSDGLNFTGAERTAALIKAWEEAQTGPVAIFVTSQGMMDEEGRARIESYAQAGHLIANHSHSHMWASRTDQEAYLADIDQAEALLAGLNNRRPWYRFPYLDEGGYGKDEQAALQKRDALRDALAERNLISGYVTVDTFDWHLDRLWQDAVRNGRSVNRESLAKVYADMVVDAANHYDQMALDILGRRPAHTLLLHENDLAAAFTSEMVAALRANGWILIDPDTAFADPIVDQLPETRFAGDGRIAAIARDGGKVGADYFDHWSASEAGIEARLAEHSVFDD